MDVNAETSRRCPPGPRSSPGPVQYGYWRYERVPVLFTALSNGAETAILLLSPDGTPWPSGPCWLDAVFDRDRWQASVSTDLELHHHDTATLALRRHRRPDGGPCPRPLRAGTGRWPACLVR